MGAFELKAAGRSRRLSGKKGWAATACLLAVIALSSCGSLLSPATAAASPTGSIAGKVTNAIGHAPIEGVEVCALNPSNHDYEGCQTTDAAGGYEIEGLSAGSYKVEFSTYGSLNYLTQYYNGKPSFSAGDSVAVTGGSTTAGIDAELHAGGQIKGKVVDATSKAGVEGVEVCADEIGGAEEFQCAGTEASGEYAISRLPTGSYKVEFSTYGSLNYITQYYNGKPSFEAADPVSVTAGSVTSSIDAELHEGGRIKGKVIDAVSKAPLEEIEVCAFEAESEYSVRCDYTDSEGEYTLSNLTSGSYEVKFKPGFNDHTHVKQYYNGKPSFEAADPVSVTAGATTAGIDAELHEGGRISGTVTKAAGGGAIEGILVCAITTHYEFSEYGSSCGSTNAAGEYTITGLAEGSYKVQFSGGLNYLSQYYDDVATEMTASAVSVTLGATTPNIDAELRAAGQIKGKITDAVTKAPLSNIEACALLAESSYYQPAACGYVQVNGEYTIGGLAPGSYKVRFTPGYGEIAPGEYGQLNYVTQFYNGKATEEEAEAVSVMAGSATSGIDAEMHAGGKITGKVIGAASKAPLKGVEVCANPTSKRASPGGCAQTNSEGEYSIARLATGSYRVKFQPGYEHREFLRQYYNGEPAKGEADPVSVTAGSTTSSIDAELLKGGEVTGTVVDASSKAPLEEIEACAGGFCATTDAAGEYTIQGVPTGLYKVHFTPYYESPNKNYIGRYYNGKTTYETADEVSVAAGATTPNIDAELHEGGKISGTIVDATTKAALQHVEVCALLSGGEEYEYAGCARTDASGNYTIEGLSGGTYKVGFFTGAYEGSEAPSANYLTQYYSGKDSQESGDSVSVTAGATTAGIDAELHEGGKISGKVTGAPGATPVQYAEACAIKVGASEEEYGRCDLTDASGDYTIEGLAAGSYTVSFSIFLPGSEAQSNYLRQFYNDKASAEAANPVAVTIGTTTPNVNAELHAGGQIKGKVVDATNGVPLQGVSACALVAGVSEELFGNCGQTNGSGEYTIPGLASGSYVVKFSALSYEYEEGIGFEAEVSPEEEFTTQFYNGKASFGQATPVSVTAGLAVTGINASMVEVAAAPAKPVNTGAPLLSGTPAPGEVLSCSPGLWSGSPTGYSYRWLRDGVEIAGKVASTYTVQGADQGHAISCKVTASNGKGSTSAVSNAVQVPAEGAGGTQHTLLISPAGSGSGKVTSSPAGISCGPVCSHAFASGTSVVLTAVPAAGSVFAGWSGAGCAGTGTCHVTLNGDASITASFNAEAGGGGGGGGGGSPGGGATGGAPSSTPSSTPAPKPKALKCRKGFTKKTVKGKAKCVKAKKHGKKGK